MALMRIFIFITLLCAISAFAFWLLADWGPFALILLVSLGLASYQLPREYRHLQWPLPLAALIWSIICWGLLLWMQDKYPALLAAHAGMLSWLERLGIVIPKDIGAFLPMGNAIFLTLFALAKGLFIFVRRQHWSEKPTTQVLGGIAYVLQPGPSQSWVLQPGWLCVRWMSSTAAMLGFVGMLAAWLVSIGKIQASWIPLLPAGLFLFSMELALWLWGLLDEKWRPVFDGTDANAVTHGDFDALWRRYRAIWQHSWLVAGNRLPSDKN